MEIIREFNKESLLNCYLIYINYTWSMLPIIKPALISMFHPHILLKATMLHLCALILSSRFFYHILGLWHHIMWYVMWLQCHMPLHHPKSRKQNKINIKSETLDKRKEKLLLSKAFHNTLTHIYCNLLHLTWFSCFISPHLI